MKRFTQLLVCIIIGIVVASPHAHARSASAFRDHIMQAVLALEERDYALTLRHLKAAHFIDRSHPEPFDLLRQIPPPRGVRPSTQFYYDLGTEFDIQGDSRSAEFYYAAAQQFNRKPRRAPSIQEPVPRMRESPPDIRQPQPEPLPQPELQSQPRRSRLSVETGPVHVKGQQRQSTQRYSVEHTEEIEVILDKYRDPVPQQRAVRRQKITAAKDDMSRSLDQFTRAVKAEKLKQQTVSPRIADDPQPRPQKRSVSVVDPPVPQSETTPKSESKQTDRLMSQDIPVADSPQESRIESSTKLRKLPFMRRTEREVVQTEEVVRLEEELWALQPGTVLEIEFGKTIIIEGQGVRRFFVFNPNVSQAERQTQDRVTVTILRRGSTLFHIWDERGRWTFNLKGVLPI